MLPSYVVAVEVYGLLFYIYGYYLTNNLLIALLYAGVEQSSRDKTVPSFAGNKNHSDLQEV
jgi:hypothetical protein